MFYSSILGGTPALFVFLDPNCGTMVLQISLRVAKLLRGKGYLQNVYKIRKQRNET